MWLLAGWAARRVKKYPFCIAFASLRALILLEVLGRSQPFLLVATSLVDLFAEALRTVFTQGCRVVHLTCHGSERVFLLETEQGVCQPITREGLGDLLSAGMEPGEVQVCGR